MSTKTAPPAGSGTVPKSPQAAQNDYDLEYLEAVEKGANGRSERTIAAAGWYSREQNAAVICGALILKGMDGEAAVERAVQLVDQLRARLQK